MPTSKFYWCAFVRINYMQISLFKLLSSLMFFSDTLKNHIWPLWLIEGYHLKLLACSKLNHLGEESLADLALKFREIIGDCDIVELSLNFTIDPVFETANMNKLTGAFTFARTDQRILLG